MASTWNTLSESAKYAKYRPTYPKALYDRILSEVPVSHRNVLLDIGCGSGQATIPMSKYFKRTVGIDAAASQIAEAKAAAATADAERGVVASSSTLCFEVGRAGDRSAFDAVRRAIPDGEKADVIIVAEALHWFDLQRFNAHLPSLLKPDGLLAVWVYEADDLTPVACDNIFKSMHHMLLTNNHWPVERHHIEDGYSRIIPAMVPHPMRLTATIKMRPVTRRSVDDFAAYLSTWSGVMRCMEHTGDSALLGRLSNEMRAALVAESATELVCELPITLFLLRLAGGGCPRQGTASAATPMPSRL